MQVIVGRARPVDRLEIDALRKALVWPRTEVIAMLSAILASMFQSLDLSVLLWETFLTLTNQSAPDAIRTTDEDLRPR